MDMLKTRFTGNGKQVRAVSRAARLLDLAGIGLFFVGAAIYASAWVGLRQMRDFVPTPHGPAFEAMARFDELVTLSRIGVLLMIVAGAVALFAAGFSIWQRRAASGAAA
jgi:hypothetical protein